MGGFGCGELIASLPKASAVGIFRDDSNWLLTSFRDLRRLKRQKLIRTSKGYFFRGFFWDFRHHDKGSQVWISELKHHRIFCLLLSAAYCILISLLHNKVPPEAGFFFDGIGIDEIRANWQDF